MSMSPAASALLNVVRVFLSGEAQDGVLLDREHITKTVERFAPIAGIGLSANDLTVVIGELEKSFNVWSGRAGALLGEDPGYLAWLPGRRDEVKWRFWNRYRLFVAGKFPPRVLEEMDSVTDEVLGYLENPERTGAWRRHGLVVGHVQSGKTANYTGLICKAADAGYKVIVVLAGIHNSLRSQTQIRLDEGFLGYARPFDGSKGYGTPVGVGLLDPSVIADTVTTRDERGDFNATKAKGFQIHAGGNVLLFVVKKNAAVLKNLLRWAELNAKTTTTSGKTLVSGVPLLVIDDEADQASIDTNYQVFDEHGRPDPNHDPKPINKLIRSVLQRFEKAAYIGYTATPFANVFIHHRGETEDLGPDLFPKHFIVSLAASTDYFGPAKVFGFAESTLPIHGNIPSRLRFITDAAEWSPPSHKSTLVPRFEGRDCLPPSLQEAISAFILSSAARRARGQEAAHKSMLIHVTRFTDVQNIVHRQVHKFVEELRNRWRGRSTTAGERVLHDFQDTWQRDFVATSQSHGEDVPNWKQIETHIWPILEAVKVNLINAKASDALIYQEHSKNGLHVIAIGGDKLSRGLTLEGLSVSYFLRASRMYDTLMQMGRWFGYRPGYEDLCRLYLSEELSNWYTHIVEASEELRAEFDRMVLENGTPEDYGFRVRTHPVLAITGKLRPGLREITTSLSATPFEPTVLREDQVSANWESTMAFLDSIKTVPTTGFKAADSEVKERRGSWPGSVLWRDVRGVQVLEFLRRYSFADQDLTRTPSTVVRDYITQRLDEGELTTWTVVLLGKLDSEEGIPSVPYGTNALPDQFHTLFRKYHGTPRADRYIVKRTGSPKDESIDLSPEEWKQVVEQRSQLSKSVDEAKEYRLGRLIRQARPASRGLLILYALTPSRENQDKGVVQPMIAPYISFPYSQTASPITYKLSALYWEQELSGAE